MRDDALYRDGYRCALDGCPIEEAPSGEAEARQWRRGWRAAARDFGSPVRGPRDATPAARLESEVEGP